MGYSDLMDRMMRKDTDAFLEMTDRYGWAVYSAIQKKHPDRATADRIYNDTMNGIYRALQNPDCDDPFEALLCSFSDYFTGDNIPNEISVLSDRNEPPTIQCEYVEPTYRHEKAHRKGFLHYLGVVTITIAIALALWLTAGVLMDKGYIPYLNWGHLWVTENVVPILNQLRDYIFQIPEFFRRA